MNPPDYRTARALYPHRPEWEVLDYLYVPLPVPEDHPELDLFGFDRARATLESDNTSESDTVARLTPSKRAEIQTEEAPTPPTAELPAENTEPLTARHLNEYVYCQRLFYYEHVEGIFVENADTARGTALHERVDRGKGALQRAAARKRKEAKDKAAGADTVTEASTQDASTPPPSDTEALTSTDRALTDLKEHRPEPPRRASETIHSRSAMLGSTRLGVVAKMDLIELTMTERGLDDLFAQREVQKVTPVDYKAGAPRQGPDQNELWDADKMQLGLQILILRDNGYVCDEGVIYYCTTRQRVRLQMTPDLETWIQDQILAARALTTSREIPPPLRNSPKCVRCSLAPVCLPDETLLLQQRQPVQERHIPTTTSIGNKESPPTPPPNKPTRRLIAARDDERALYLNTQGYRVGLKAERLVVKEGDQVVDEVRLHDVSHVSLFGHIQLTTQAIQQLCEQEIPVAYFSMGGWFYGLTRGHGLKNVHTRIRQFATAANPLRCLQIAQRMVQGKIKNHRVMLMRSHVSQPTRALEGLKEIAARVTKARGLDELLGMEGAAAALYFSEFSGMIKVGTDDLDDEIPGLETPELTKSRQHRETEAFNFDFTHRRRRPATDPVNALLSLAYSLLAKDCTIAALHVGFDPYVGFYHQPRHGRPALALDLMEEFRPLIAESAVLTAINNRMVTPEDFVRAGESVSLTPQGRKSFFHAYEQRMNAMIVHPVFEYKVSYRRVIELQARLLARWLTGEIADYIPMTTR